ncbi:PaaI family thioesterase [Agarivorans sp. MS3-6]
MPINTHSVNPLHTQCVACGSTAQQASSLALRFRPEGEASVVGHFEVGLNHQGYNGLLHGGLICTLLDASMTHCLFRHKVTALTAELSTRFIKPIKVGQQLLITARLLSHRRGIYKLEAHITHDLNVVARAEAKFVASEF